MLSRSNCRQLGAEIASDACWREGGYFDSTVDFAIPHSQVSRQFRPKFDQEGRK